MEVIVRNHQKKISLNVPRIIQITTRILKGQGIKKASVTLVFVTHQRIRAMNKRYLRKDRATDVLAFDVSSSYYPNIKTFAGDIVISTDAVISNSRSFKVSFAYELTLYIVHGILHLLGFDDHRPLDIKRMRAKEQEIMDLLGKQGFEAVLYDR